jgi:crotonobetainyl-CoA:carnitine CoA-transferase CaiB-like acyl-CoA transferase
MLANDPRYATSSGRIVNAEPLDRDIGDELLWQRGLYRFVSDHREGQRPVLGPPWRMSRASARVERGAPDLGEDNDYVFNDILKKVTK